jgi:hypothetical protein
VRFLVPIDPGYFLTGLYRDSRWIEHEILDLDFVFGVPGAGAVCHFISKSGEAEVQNDQDG